MYCTVITINIKKGRIEEYSGIIRNIEEYSGINPNITIISFKENKRMNREFTCHRSGHVTHRK